MNGLMMDFQLTLPHLLQRSETLLARGEIVTRLPDKSLHRTTYGETMARARQLAVALGRLGLERGDRVATLCWNHHQHHEAYFGIPCGGFVLHTLNLRLHPNDLAYIADHAGDRAVIVDRSLVPVLDQFKDRTRIEHVFVVEDSYEELLETASPDEWRDPELDENEAAAMCYTSGTTGLPKGVAYSHRSTILHTLGVTANNPLGIGISVNDAILPVVPMFHANAWGYPYVATMTGSKLVYPGPHLDPESLLDLMSQERVAWAAGVPTIWMGILQLLDAHTERWDLSSMKAMLVGGSAVPRAMIAAYEQRHGIKIVQGWGMTETSPVASTATLPHDLADVDEEMRFDIESWAGMPLPLVEIRIRVGDEDQPWDGETMGELEVRGPWVASGYYDTPEQADRWTEDGWFRTGDIASIHPRGYIQIKDRSKDVIKSGGEWISSVELENAIMAHPAVAEAAVIAIPDEKWAERPLAAVVLKEGSSATADELREFLAPQFAKWWLPDRIEFISEIPKTSVGKFRKTALREQFAQEPVTR
ncbi:MAG TPA: long-chain fatty acid--CoA ligase [Gaiellaceae bacterium]|jgi:fatty-acyl-CoA synthase|nr:long-chain fatty acid--CoA ligase [Gaiellaceae bacterium]